MGQERQVLGAEVLPVQVVRVGIQLVVEPHERRLAVLGVDHRAGELSVEAVDRARRQVPLGPRRVGLARRIVGGGGSTVLVDGLDRGGGERVRSNLQVELVDDRVRGTNLVRPHLVLLVVQRALLTGTLPGRLRPAAERRRGNRSRRLRHRQRVLERFEDERAGREGLDVDGIGDRRGSGGEDALRRHQPPRAQVGLGQRSAPGHGHSGHSERAEAQQGAAGEGASLLGLLLDIGEAGVRGKQELRLRLPDHGGALHTELVVHVMTPSRTSVWYGPVRADLGGRRRPAAKGPLAHRSTVSRPHSYSHEINPLWFPSAPPALWESETSRYGITNRGVVIPPSGGCSEPSFGGVAVGVGQLLPQGPRRWPAG